eukprot:CAMPEP_0116840470 /NCGR_PEP_ID=MMETSP0418-20121206/10372_1 /TAXON_ID=1158023 /ORGANISM="Astrosyne radiata, Strain 13vi08-1A" /LENGTH=162 /DNA_ID=CAMNT_0004470759 /DNA_START=733 /DNA_END=1222 /DNA_ORIENTATION=-
MTKGRYPLLSAVAISNFRVVGTRGASFTALARHTKMDSGSTNRSNKDGYATMDHTLYEEDKLAIALKKNKPRSASEMRALFGQSEIVGRYASTHISHTGSTKTHARFRKFVHVACLPPPVENKHSLAEAFSCAPITIPPWFAIHDRAHGHLREMYLRLEAKG